jgi:hypothetical protein
MAKKKPTAKDMADMLSNKPLPGQAIAIGPDVDPRAAEFQQAMSSMMATPDDYYRWERDRAIEEQDKKAFKGAFESMIADKDDPGAKWQEFLDETSPVKEMAKRQAYETFEAYPEIIEANRMRHQERINRELLRISDMLDTGALMGTLPPDSPEIEAYTIAKDRRRAMIQQLQRSQDTGKLTSQEKVMWNTLLQPMTF